MGGGRVRMLGVVAIAMTAFRAVAAPTIEIAPSLQITAVDDDNLNFSFDQPVADRIQRLTPEVLLRLDSERWAAEALYSLDSEQYATHADLDDDRARERARAAIRYIATPRLTFMIDGSYLNTNTLADLNTETHLAVSRIRGERTTLGSSARFQVSPRSTMQASTIQTITSTEDGSGFEDVTHFVTLERKITPRDTVVFRYDHSNVAFSGLNAPEDIAMDVVTAGWSRNLGPKTHLALQAGPRLTNGVRGVDASATLRHDWRSAAIELAFVQNQSVPAGYARLVETRSWQTTLSWTPFERLEVTARPAFVHSTHEALQAEVYRLDLHFRYAPSPLFAFDVQYDRGWQIGSLDSAWAAAELTRSTLSAGVSTRWAR